MLSNSWLIIRRIIFTLRKVICSNPKEGVWQRFFIRLIFSTTVQSQFRNRLIFFGSLEQCLCIFWNENVWLATYSWASDSCWTSLKRRGEQIELFATSGFFSELSTAKCFRIKRDTRSCGRSCHSCITSFGVFTCHIHKRYYSHCNKNHRKSHRTWSPFKRSNSVTHTMAERMPAWYVSAANIVHSISILITPKLCSLFRYSILSFSVKSQNAPSNRPCPVNTARNCFIKSVKSNAKRSLNAVQYLHKNHRHTWFFPSPYRMDRSLDQLGFSIRVPIFYLISLVVALICLRPAAKKRQFTLAAINMQSIKWLLASSKVFRNRPSMASSVMTTVPPSTPMPPHVPIRMKMGSLHFAWYINLIISCSNMPTEGVPIPWLTHSTGPTYIDIYAIS